MGVALLLLALAREGPQRASGTEPMDFVQYYFTGWRLAHGLAVYEPVEIKGELARAVGWQNAIGLRMANPPAMVCLTWPMALVPYPLAWWALASGSIIALGIGSWFAARHSGWDRAESSTWAAVAVGSVPSLTFIILNHIEAPILLLGVGGWLALRRGRTMLGASMWGIAAALKLFPAFWLVALLGRRDRSTAVAGFGTAAALSAIGAAVVGWEATTVFVRDVLPQAKLWESDPANMSVRSFGNDIFGPMGGIALTLATAVILLWAIFSGDRSVDRLWCLGLCGSLLLSPLSWSYYFVLVVPVAALVSARLDLSKTPWRIAFGLGIVTLFFWPPLLGRWLPGSATFHSWGWPWIVARHMPTFALAALAWTGHRFLRNSPESSPHVVDPPP